MKMKNRNRPGSDFSYKARALAEAPTTFKVYTVNVKATGKVTADVKALARLDVAAKVGKAMREQGKHIVKGCAAVYDSKGVLCTRGCGKSVTWRCVVTGKFVPAPV